MKVVVFGGYGFVGPNLAQVLVNKGHNVFPLSRRLFPLSRR